MNTMPKLIKQFIKRVLPNPIIKCLKKVNFTIKLEKIRRNHQKALKRIRKKEKVKVVFFLIHDSVWKYEGVYKLMEQDERFEPIVVVCPYITYGEEYMLRVMKAALNSFKEKGYNVINSFNDETGEWINVKKEIKPDIIFFTNPHKLTKDAYYIDNYLDCLTCYVPYTYLVTHMLDMHYNQKFHHFLWRHFCETKMHEDFSHKYLKKNNFNTKVTGFPGLDPLYERKETNSKVWKNTNENLKRIIWAPHHTIDNDKNFLSYSNFVKYAQFMLELNHKYKESIQMAFKPHPILRLKLYKHKDWGKEKTNIYYNRWAEMPNGQLEEGDYLDLFASSDAMILDSASFMVEYLFTGKPSLFTKRDKDIEKRFNDFGKLIYHKLYHANNENDITNFINKVVLGSKDIMFEDRNNIFRNIVLPPKGKTASENIFNELLKEIKN